MVISVVLPANKQFPQFFFVLCKKYLHSFDFLQLNQSGSNLIEQYKRCSNWSGWMESICKDTFTNYIYKSCYKFFIGFSSGLSLGHSLYLIQNISV